MSFDVKEIFLKLGFDDEFIEENEHSLDEFVWELFSNFFEEQKREKESFRGLNSELEAFRYADAYSLYLMGIDRKGEKEVVYPFEVRLYRRKYEVPIESYYSYSLVLDMLFSTDYKIMFEIEDIVFNGYRNTKQYDELRTEILHLMANKKFHRLKGSANISVFDFCYEVYDKFMATCMSWFNEEVVELVRGVGKNTAQKTLPDQAFFVLKEKLGW